MVLDLPYDIPKYSSELLLFDLWKRLRTDYPTEAACLRDDMKM